MARTIVGLFGTADQASQAAVELSSIGVGTDEISVVAQGQAEGREQSVGEEAGRGAGVVSALLDLGVPAERAEACAEAVGRGGVLLVVRSGRVPDANVEAVMLTNAAAEISAWGAAG